MHETKAQTYIARFFCIPQFEQSVERPLDALNALLLVLLGILSGKDLGRD